MDEHAKSSVEAVHYVGDYLDELGATVHYTDKFEFPPGSGIEQQQLVAVFYPPGEEDKPCDNALAFSSHIDVVPATPTSDGRDIHKLTQIDDKLYARGTTDMQGALTGVMMALKAQKEELKNTKRPVVVMLSSCEEAGAQGVGKLCDFMKEKQITPSEVIVTEPTESYIGSGGAGGIGYRVTLEADAAAPAKEAKPFDAAIEITFDNPTSYPFLGAMVKNPAQFLGAMVHQFAIQPQQGNSHLPLANLLLNTKGVDVEVCQASIGNSAGTIAEKQSKLMIGFHGDKYQIDGVIKQIGKHMSVMAKAYDGLTTFATRGIAKEHEVDLGTIETDIREMSEKETAALSSHTHANALDAALGVAMNITRYDASLKLPIYADTKYPVKDYAAPQIGIVHMQSETPDKAEMFVLGTSRVSYQGDRMRGDMDKRFAKLKSYYADRGITLKSELIALDQSYQAHDESVVKDYVRIAKDSGFSKKPRGQSPMPYPCDGGKIAQAFPKANVLLAAAAGYKNNAHGSEEHITEDQARRDINFYGAVIKQRALELPTQRINHTGQGQQQTAR